MGITTVADIVRIHGAEWPERIALVLGERRMTWAELLRRSAQVAHGLGEAGVRSTDHVAFLDKNGIEHFEVFFGAAMHNAICVDVNWRLAAPEVEYIVNDAEAKVLVVGPEFVSVLDTISPNLTTVSLILVIGGHPGYESYEDWVDRQPAIDPRTAATSADTAFQLYSSGTTGRPKGVMLSNSNVFALLPMARQCWGLSPDSVNMVAMPLFHIGGGGWAVAGMYEGAVSVIIRDLDPVALVRQITELRISHGFVVPAVLQFLLMVPGITEADLSSLRVIVYGASPISDAVLAKSIEVFGCDFWQAYGLTETTGTVINLAPADHDLNGPNRHRLRSCGVPGPQVEVKIVDTEMGDEMPTGEVGEILIRSPQVMTGYWKMPEETEQAITADGWFKTGDIGSVDADGYVFIHDRVKDMIVSGGENVYPAEVENVLMALPGIADVAVIGVPDEKWGETAKAMVVRAAGSEVTEAEIIAYARDRLARFKCPTTVEFIELLPRNPSGKVLKKDLRAPFWEGRARQVN